MSLGRSLLGREIPVIRLGQGRDTVVYVGALSGQDSLTAGVLMEFVADYLSHLEKNDLVFERRMKVLSHERTVFVIPMLNPDGVGYALHGVGKENPLSERVRGMNGGEDFSRWCANARGVDLAHNFETGFAAYKERERAKNTPCGAPVGYSGEYPESEPETASLCRFLRSIAPDIKGILHLRCGTGEVLCPCADKLSAKSMAVGRVLSRSAGYRLLSPTELTPAGGLSEWCIERLSRPAFTLSCGTGAPLSAKALFELTRRALFTFPFMV